MSEQDFISFFEDNTEVIVDLPEGMKSSEIDSLLNMYYNETSLFIDSECNSTNAGAYFSAEDYIERLTRLPYIMEMPYNSIVRKFIDRYCTKMTRSMGIMLGAANFYTPIFEEALEAYGVPLELKYLPVIESALNPKATSPVGAAGLWQFMPGTGKQYGLTINSLVDERRDPIKSSYAAARMLRDLYNVFNDWSTVIAAYNCGPGNVKKAMKRAGGTTDYWKLYPYLPRETRGYVPAFIAANYAMNYYCEHGICPMRTRLPAHSDTVMVSRQIHFKQIAEKCGISIDELRVLNPQYRKDIVCGSTKEPAILRLPDKFISIFIDNVEDISAHRREYFLPRRETVEIGGN
ncbi:MAG: lytic transglycosylase domain-containing protein [Bacteroidaceae bacterium]|nr:lytic transglycosylase domain-containing protein [Bacteroidaceae bacterium]